MTADPLALPTHSHVCTCTDCGQSWGYNRFGYDQTRNHLTTGSWHTEADSVQALDAILNQISQFDVYNEVRGFYLQPRLDQEQKQPRIDRLLVPRPELVKAGWRYGPVGIECKRSGDKIGRPIAQMLDYSRAAWRLNPNIWITLEWIFLWPLEKTSGTVASILAQHRLGSAEPGSYYQLKLSSGEVVLATFNNDNTVRLGTVSNGRKTGSR